MSTRITRFILGALLLATAGAGVAQGPPGQDPYNPPPGHGGVPPGQAKKQGYGKVPPGQAKKQGYGNVPPGQAKKYGGDFHFRGEDGERLYGYYRSDVGRWRGRKRPAFVAGELIPGGYVIRSVPQSYWVGAPPPPGYRYGYYAGYVVAYDPTTRVIADVLDLVSVAPR